MIVASSIDVHVPASAAYREWVTLRNLPRFMRRVVDVHRDARGAVLVRARVAGGLIEHKGRIVDLVRDRRITWKGTDGPCRQAQIDFSPRRDSKCRVGVRLEYPSRTPEANIRGAKQDLDEDLLSFANFTERQRAESDRWR